ncbi:hypothetical protein [Streptomyces sp. NPDC047046]|uniref:hypothetical protein n=1 Tax=Streptomyces sp. NPDC047046 TaxID=3155378 RepID=UPI0033F2A5ED
MADMTREKLERPVSAVVLTDEAVAKITALLQDAEPGLALQVTVEPGGCAGLRYQLLFTDKYAKALVRMRAERAGETFTHDEETTAQSAALEADGMSVGWFGTVAVVTSAHDDHQLTGARLGYQETLESWGFTIDNPSTTAPCSCSRAEPCGR